MTILTKASDFARSEGDPVVLENGPSSRQPPDSLTRALGWFSIGLGLVEIFGAERLTRALGMEQREGLVRAFGFRELGSGVACLSADTTAGMWSRVGGDALDLAALFSAYNDENPKKHNVGWAMAAVAAVTLIDLATAQVLTQRLRHGRKNIKDYSDRSGWPHGVERSRGAATDFRKPDDLRAVPLAANASPVTGRTSRATANIVRAGPD
jgi:hypothetical protein